MYTSVHTLSLHVTLPIWSADGARSELAGTVVISAPPALAALALTAPLLDLQHRHPRLTIRIIGEARAASLDRAEADIAIRLSRPESGDLTITKLGKVDFRLYAGHGYLAATTEEKNWRFIGSDGPLAHAPQQAAIEAFAAGRPFAFYSSSLDIQQAAARNGAGIAALPDFMGMPDAELAPVFPDTRLISRDIWLVVHSDLKRAASIKAVLQQLRAVFASTPPGGGPFALDSGGRDGSEAAARNGGVFARLPDFVGWPDAERAPGFPDTRLSPRDIWLVVHSDLKRAASIKAVLQQLRAVFASTPPGGGRA